MTTPPTPQQELFEVIRKALYLPGSAHPVDKARAFRAAVTATRKVEAELVVARERERELREHIDQYEATCKAIERALFGDDFGRSRDELEERAEYLRRAHSPLDGAA